MFSLFLQLLILQIRFFLHHIILPSNFFWNIMCVLSIFGNHFLSFFFFIIQVPLIFLWVGLLFTWSTIWSQLPNSSHLKLFQLSMQPLPITLLFPRIWLYFIHTYKIFPMILVFKLFYLFIPLHSAL